MPTSSSPAPNEKATWLFTDADGRLLLVEAEPGDTPHETRWFASAYAGRRRLDFRTGICVHDRVGHQHAQIVRAAKSAFANAVAEAADRPVVAGRILLPAAGDDDRHGARIRFAAACGSAALRAETVGLAAESLLPFDSAHGREAVDGFFGASPLLLPILAGHDPARQPGAHPGVALLSVRDGLSLATGVLSILGLQTGEEAVRRTAASLPVLSHLPIDLRFARLLVQAATHVPAEWLPRDVPEAFDFVVAVEAARHLGLKSGSKLDMGVLLRAAKGRWCGFRERLRLGIDASYDLEQAVERAGEEAGDVADMVSAFRRQVAVPVLCHAANATGRPAQQGRSAAQAVAWEILLGRKGMAAVFEASRRWHGSRPGMDIVIATTEDERRWPSHFPDFVASNGRRVVALSSADELLREGNLLRHCVGSYAWACARGSCVIASVRDPHDRVGSTVQLGTAYRVADGRRVWSPIVQQHRGMANGRPNPDDVIAVGEFILHVPTQGLPPPGPAPAPDPGILDRLRRRIGAWKTNFGSRRAVVAGPPPDRYQDYADLEEEAADIADGWAGYDPGDRERVEAAILAWSPFLPRDLRGGMRPLLDRLDPDLASAFAG